MVILLCTGVRYCSQTDEDIFFEWISRVPAIIKFHGSGKDLFLHIKSKRLSYKNLIELLALFYRYNINMKQLAQFLSPQNKQWFYENKTAYWHKRVFGK